MKKIERVDNLFLTKDKAEVKIMPPNKYVKRVLSKLKEYGIKVYDHYSIDDNYYVIRHQIILRILRRIEKEIEKDKNRKELPVIAYVRNFSNDSTLSAYDTLPILKFLPRF